MSMLEDIKQDLRERAQHVQEQIEQEDLLPELNDEEQEAYQWLKDNLAGLESEDVRPSEFEAKLEAVEHTVKELAPGEQ